MTNDQLSSLYTNFESQIMSANYDQARVTLEEISQIYRSTDNIQVDKVQAVWPTKNTTTEEKQSLTEYTRQSLRTQGWRVQFLTNAFRFINNPDESDMEEVLSSLSQVQSAETSQKNKAENATSITNSVNVPPHVKITTVAGGKSTTDVVTNTDTQLVVTVQNVGDTIATDVTLSVTSSIESPSPSPNIPDGLSISPNPAAIGQIGGEESFSQLFTVSGSEIGKYPLLMRLTSSQNSDTADHMVNVTAVSPSDPKIVDYTNAQNRVDEAGLSKAVDDWIDREIDIHLLQTVIKAWREERVVAEP